MSRFGSIAAGDAGNGAALGAYRLAETPLARPLWLPFPFLIPVILCGASWGVGGMPFLTDMGFLSLTLLCFAVVLMETFSFTRRFGIGGIVLCIGSLIWFCHDYFSKWFGVNFALGDLPFSATTVAKGAFFTSLFIFCGIIGLLLPVSKRLVSASRYIPEPPSTNVYVAVIFISFFIGLIPYLFFSAEPIYLNIYRAMTGLRAAGEGAGFTAGRTGNYNYSWGAYLAQVEQIGSVGSIFAIFYVVMTPGFSLPKVAAVLIWLFWTAIGFGSGSRGELIQLVVPVAAVVFLKYMKDAAVLGRRFPGRSVAVPGVVIFITLFFVQIQGTYRESGLSTFSWDTFHMFEAQGNTMFSEGLLGYETFPDIQPFSSDEFAGSHFVMPIPDVVVRFSIGWIPRVLWHGKPGISAVGQWYNQQESGGTAANEEEGQTQADVSGGTVAPSICGLAYIGYGTSGVIQIGLLFGWLCKLAERILWANLNRVLGTMFSLGIAVYLFRAFRDLTPHDFYPLCIAVLAASVLVWALSGFNWRSIIAPSYPDQAAFA